MARDDFAVLLCSLLHVDELRNISENAVHGGMASATTAVVRLQGHASLARAIGDFLHVKDDENMGVRRMLYVLLLVVLLFLAGCLLLQLPLLLFF